MRTTFFTALAFGGLVATSVASPIASPVEPVAPEVETQGQVYDDDYGYQGGVLESVLEQVSNHVNLVTSILDGVTGVASPSEALGLVGQIAPQLGAVTSLLDNIPVIGSGRGRYQYPRDGEVEAQGYGKGKAPGYKQQCSKLCIFDLVGKLVLQIHDLVSQCVNKVGLGFAFQYLSPLALTLVKTLSSFDLVIGGVLEPVQGVVNQMLGKLGSGLLGGLPGLGGGNGGGY